MSEFTGGEASRNKYFFEYNVGKKSNILRGLVAQVLPATYTKTFDISRWQGIIDFTAAYVAGYRLVIIKATEALAKDPMYDTYWKQAHDAGFDIMTYHFNRSNIDGKAQADYHLEVTKELRNTITYKHASALDIETNDSTTIAVRQTRVKAFLNEVALEGVLPGVYSSRNYWQTLMNNMILPSNVWGYVAAWTPLASPIIPTGWTELQTKVWQYGVYDLHDWAESVPGVSPLRDVDVDRWFGNEASLNSFLKKSIEPISHSHLEYEKRLTALEDNQKKFNERITALEQARVYFLVEEDIANTYRVKSKNIAGYPIMVPANDLPDKIQYSKGSKVQVIPLIVNADGSVNYWKIVGKELYLRNPDGYIELY